MRECGPYLAWRREALRVEVYEDRAALGRAAAADAAAAIRAAQRGGARCRVVFAAAPSQNELLAGLAAAPGIDWGRVEAFHMDEYLGLPAGAPERFGSFLRRALFGRLPLGRTEYLAADPGLDAEEEAARYEALLREAPLDLVCLGVGENGHIAFNDPGAADFRDARGVKPVELDPACRAQQVHDGCFPELAAVPARALTLTIPTLLSAGRLVCSVPGPAKARAVRELLEGPIAEACPASALRLHPDCTLYLDAESAGELR